MFADACFLPLSTAVFSSFFSPIIMYYIFVNDDAESIFCLLCGQFKQYLTFILTVKYHSGVVLLIVTQLQLYIVMLLLIQYSIVTMNLNFMSLLVMLPHSLAHYTCMK